MSRLLILIIALLSQTLLLADPHKIYDIRGASEKLDANLTQFLVAWRTDTITPIQNGTYCKVCVNGDTDRKTVALTFDDAPDENVTSQILDVLKETNVQASFFMIGQTMEDTNTTAVIRAANEGHLVLNHSFSHPHLSALTPEKITHELNAASERINALTGHYPLLIRPPYGSIDQSVVDTINAQGFTTVLWSLDSLDWAIKEKDAIIDNVLANIRPGDIVLMHSGQSNHATAEALPLLIDKLRQSGYTFVRVDEMLGIRAYR